MFVRSLILALALLLPLRGWAHSVWIEPLPDGQLCVRFAQWGDDYEKSPGHLDSFAEASGWTLDEQGKSQDFAVEKKSDHFLLPKSEAGKAAYAQLPFAIRKLHDDKPARAPIFYCRWQPEGAGAGKPALTMDLVPTGKPGEARVYFRGKPLPDVEVLIMTPDFNEKKTKADAEGLVRIEDTSKPGPYLLSVARYSEELPGFYRGVPFGVSSHSASLCWVVKKP